VTMLYAISYDIPDNKRRLKIAKTLKDYGERVHLSVFEARLENSQLKRMKERIKRIINQEEDSVRIYSLCAACSEKIDIIGYGKMVQDPDVIVI
jgi:CRISPR-associated protein Cas2